MKYFNKEKYNFLLCFFGTFFLTCNSLILGKKEVKPSFETTIKGLYEEFNKKGNEEGGKKILSLRHFVQFVLGLRPEQVAPIYQKNIGKNLSGVQFVKNFEALTSYQKMTQVLFPFITSEIESASKKAKAKQQEASDLPKGDERKEKILKKVAEFKRKIAEGERDLKLLQGLYNPQCVFLKSSGTSLKAPAEKINFEKNALDLDSAAFFKLLLEKFNLIVDASVPYKEVVISELLHSIMLKDSGITVIPATSRGNNNSAEQLHLYDICIGFPPEFAEMYEIYCRYQSIKENNKKDPQILAEEALANFTLQLLMQAQQMGQPSGN